MTVSNTLMQAILSMDSYNQGYGKGIDHGELQIGTAAVNALPNGFDDSDWEDAGFYAVAYNYDGETVISYRGTNFEPFSELRLDIAHGWASGGGDFRAEQVELATQFLASVNGTVNDLGKITLTGHSLGGGLAGLMSMLYGAEAVMFDNSPYRLAAENLQYYYSLEEGLHDSSLAAQPLQLIEQARQAVLLENGDGVTIADARADAQRIFNEELSTLPPEILATLGIQFTNNATGYYLPGEVLSEPIISIDREGIRVADFMDIRAAGDYPWVSTVGLTDAAANSAAVGKSSFDTANDLHSMAALAIQIYSDENSHSEKWLPIHSQLYNSFFSADIATSIKPTNDQIYKNGFSYSHMLSTIAYSAIDDGNLVFGDSGIQSLFNDADEIGFLYGNQKKSTFFEEEIQIATDHTVPGGIITKTGVTVLSDLIVQYAGALAVNKVEVEAANSGEQGIDVREGIVGKGGNDQTFALDLSKILWDEAFRKGGTLAEGQSVNPLYKEQFIQAYFKNFDQGENFITEVLGGNTSWYNYFFPENTFDDQLLKQILQIGWSTEDTSVFDRFHVRAVQNANDIELSDRSYDNNHLTGDQVHVDVYLGDNKYSDITGTKGNDFIINGSASGIISGSEGRDFISGGEGDDNADYSLLQVSNGIKFTLDKAKDLGAANAQDDVMLVQVDKNPLKAEERDLLHSIEVIEGSQYIDSLIIEELPDDLKLKFEGLGGKKNTDVTTFIDASALENGVEFITDKKGTGSLKDTGTGGEIEFVELNAEFYNNQKAGAVIKLTDEDDVFEGTAGIVEIRAGDGDDQITVTNGTNVVYGGAGSDILISQSWGNHFYGGDGGEPDGVEDRFGVSNGTFLHDLGTEDLVWWGKDLKVNGGVQSWWMEKGWAAWQPTTAIFNAAPNLFVSAAGALAPLFLLSGKLDVLTSLMFQFYQTDSGQLVIQTAMGRGGRTVIEDYNIDLDTGKATGGISVFKQELVESGSLAAFTNYVNLATKQAFGFGIDGQDPLILDLDGDGIELSSLSVSDTYFDLDGDGFAEQAAWTKGGDDGFLARDLNDNGQIDDITELFGTAETPGLTALGVLDSNQDGKISADDAEFDTLRIWRDLDSDGQTDEGELFTLAEAGISEISLNSQTPEEDELRGNTVRAEADFTRTDGSTGKIADILLQTSEIDTKYIGDSTISAEAAALPELKGYGNLANLRIAMTNDVVLAAEVSALANLAFEATWGQLQIDTQSILYRWAGVDDVIPEALGTGAINTQMLAFLEIYSGTELVSRDGAGEPVINNENELLDTWNEILNSSTLRLGAQGPWASVFAEVEYDLATNDFFLSDMQSLSNAYTNALNSLSADPVEALTEWNDHWSPVFNNLTKTLHRSDQNIVRVDFEVQNLVRAAQNSGTTLGIAQLAAGLGIAGLQVADNSGAVLTRDTSQGGTQVYVSGTGDDQFIGGNWQDVFIFTSGFGSDVIIDNDVNLTGDRIRFTDITADQVKIEVVGEDLILSVIGTDDQIIVQGQYKAPLSTEAVTGLPGFGIEDIQFADGEIYEAGDIALAVGLGTDQDDVLDGTIREDILEGLKGDDLINGGDSGDIYFYTLGDGNDQIHDQRTQALYYGSDNLFLFGDITTENINVKRDGKSDDITLSFSDGGSILLIDQAEYSVISYGGFDLDSRIEYIIFENGETWNWLDLQNTAFKNSFTSGDDLSYGFGTTDVFLSTEGNDFLSGLDGGDTYHFDLGSGQDTIHDDSRLIDTIVTDIFSTDWYADDKLVFGEGISREDVTFSRLGENPDLHISIAGTDDAITIVGQFKANKLDLFDILGIAWFDRIETFEFSDGTVVDWEEVLNIVIQGDDGDNIIYGAYYADTLDGKAGDDFLSGGDDSDTYYFGKGYGQDVIEDDQKIILTASDDTVIFNEGVSVDDVVFSRDGNSEDLLISFADDSATLKITDQFNLAYTGLGKYWFDRIETFQFQDANSTTVSWDELFADLIEQDQTNGNDTIYGFDWNDVLDGGQGDDFLSGGNENDTYIFGAGYGHDTIDDDYETGVDNSDFDIVSFKSDLNSTDATLTRDDDNVEIVFATGERLTVLNQFNYGGLSATSYDEIEEYQFSDGTVWTIDDIRAQLLQGTDGDDVITGFGLEDVLDGGAGNDRLIGLDASDTYVFDVGYGQDVILDEVWIVSYSNQDVIEFGAGISTSNIELSKDGDDLVFSIVGATDTLTVENFFYGSFGYYEIEEFNFQDGTSWSLFDVKQFILADSITDGDDIILGYSGIDHIDGGLGNDHISTLAGDDTLIGGLGDDTLIGGNGSDTYIFGAGYGHDTIDDDYHDIFSSKTDLVSFNSDLDASDATLTRNNDHLEIFFSSGEQLTILNQFSYGGLSSISYDEIEEYQFSDGTVWTSEGIRLQLLQGTDGNDVITGYGLNDILDGGAGNDRLLGLDGSDTYKFDLGYGQDVIYDRLGIVSYTSHDVVEFGPGITTANLLFNRDGDDLVFSIQGTSDTLTIENVFEGSFGYYEVEEFRFNDGTSWSLSEVKQSLLDSSMTDGDDYVLGFGDLLNGGLGDDTIIGLAGDDLITGSLGDDVLEGGKGSDTYVYNVGDGNDTIFDSQSASYETDRVILHGINADDVLVSRSSNDSDDYILTFLNGSIVTLDEQYWGTYGSGIEEVVFDDGTVWSKADLELQYVDNRDIHSYDARRSSDRDDVITGSLGDDIISGSNGADTYIYTAGDGNDLISDTTSSSSQIDKLVLHNIESNDVTLSRSLSDLDDLILTLSDNSTIELNEYFWGYGQSIEQIIFDDGTVWTKADVEAALLTEEPEDDAIHGTDGNDTLNGTSDNEAFDGGLGDDTLSGKQGDDSYRYYSGDGDDTIKELSYHSGSDSLVFKDLNQSDVTISRSWSDAEDILITDNATGHSITLDEQLYNTKSGVEEIVYADGTVQSADSTTLRELAQYQGTTIGDTINGSSYRDVFYGGLGDDTLAGKKGDDSYLYASGDGNDTIKELNYHSGSDSLVFKDLNASDVTISRSWTDAEDILITDNSTGESITLDEQLYNTKSGVEEIVYANGAVQSADSTTLRDLAQYQGTTSDDTISGGSYRDIFDGGLGGDTLSGKQGDDSYHYGSGDGNDIIKELYYHSGTDQLVFKDLNLNDLTFSIDPTDDDDLFITVNSTSDVIELDEQLYNENAGIEEIIFADGTTFIASLANVNDLISA